MLPHFNCDVLVIGAGIAGTTAALAASDQGGHTILASTGPIFSGSSFFPGTWGLGLVGPREGRAAEQDLIDTICDVGQGMALRPLVTSFIERIPEAIGRLEASGVHLKRADNPQERDFIPCFDRSIRAWHGLGRSEYKHVVQAALVRSGIQTLPHHELLELLCDKNGVCGARLCGPQGEVIIPAGAVILATGGLGGLWRPTLTLPDVTGTGAGAALLAGARLINLEFLQIMPGMVSPVKNVVFNERTFRWAQSPAFPTNTIEQLLASRSAHGPFTSRLHDRVIDIALASHGSQGIDLELNLPSNPPEFVTTYCTWFKETFKTAPDHDLRIAPHMHASNGGILIDENGATTVPGLFACGEATGGMHGADRIGGLSSANCLVFGHAAGEAAAHWAHTHTAPNPGELKISAQAIPLVTCQDARSLLDRLHQCMGQHAMIVRIEAGLTACQQELVCIQQSMNELSATTPKQTVDKALSARLYLSLVSARTVLFAMLNRTESRGAHYRADFPEPDPSQEQPFVLSRDLLGRAQHNAQ